MRTTASRKNNMFRMDIRTLGLKIVELLHFQIVHFFRNNLFKNDRTIITSIKQHSED